MRYFVMRKKGGKMTNQEIMPNGKNSVSVGLPLHIVRIIDKMRGDIPRSAWLRKKIIKVVEAEAAVQNGTFNN